MATGLYDHLFYLLDHRRIPLARGVPRYEELLADPRAALAQQEIEIPPAPLWGTALLLGFLELLVLFLPFALITNQEPEWLEWTIWGAVYACLVLVTERLIQNEWLVLNQEGVVIRHRQEEVQCPWALFLNTSRTVDMDEAFIRVAIDDAILPALELRRNSEVVAMGREVRCEFLRLAESEVSGVQLVLRNHFVVNGISLVRLLIHVAEQKATPKADRVNSQ